jgi:hypothetical protein
MTLCATLTLQCRSSETQPRTARRDADIAMELVQINKKSTKDTRLSPLRHVPSNDIDGRLALLRQRVVAS